ncbi:hypothetical protein GS876_23545 [Rhodococcus hoagii]|nr:hypothetical protein [Prescottella equi]MBM4581026.1 hypothetical protein [Prescottella equi]MBM4685645.1 hypothetical protein [Prescottella equi]NKU31537.1 hypothetical protein [Prescottella equi]NKU32252.1 hypothetical protein [Prescottella equi]
MVNQFAFTWDNDMQGRQDGMYLLLGHIAPPMWIDAADARARIEAAGNQLAVRPRGAFFLSRGRAEELFRTLGQHLGELPPE